MTPGDSELHAENARLKKEVERLRSLLAPPPPTKPESKREPEPRPKVYMLAATPPDDGTGPSADACYQVAVILEGMNRERQPEYEWLVETAVEGVPVGAYVIDGRGLWIRVEAEDDGPVVRRTFQSDAEHREWDELFRGCLDREKAILDDCTPDLPERDPYRAGVYMRLVDLLDAEYKLAMALWESGEPNWREPLQRHLDWPADGKCSPPPGWPTRSR